MILLNLKLCAVASALLLFISCNSETQTSKIQPKEKKNRPGKISSTSSFMVKLLDSVRINANPMNNYHLNSKRADYYLMQSRTKPENSQEQAMMRAYYFWELLYAGHTEKCIEELEIEIAKYNLNLNELTPISKSYFELLALAYLRLGERANCLAHHSSKSCILPIQKEAQHSLKSGSERAIEIYSSILNNFPEDTNSRWLLNLASMTLGKYPSQVPKKNLILGLSNEIESFQFTDIAPSLGINVNGLSGGCCIDDFNNDGLLDILTTAYGYNEQTQLYLNQGKEGFENVTKQSGLVGITGGLNAIHADYNNDGNIDVFIARGGWLGQGGNHPNSLLKNVGNGQFVDVTKKAGLLSFAPTQTAVWADFNNDGNLDLFVGNESLPNGTDNECELYLNNGNETFTNVTKKAFVKLNAYVKAVTAGDVNNDGYSDLFVSVMGGDNILYINQPQADGSIRFKNMSSAYKLQKPFYSFSSFFFDYNNDGWEDLFVCGYDIRYQTKVASEYTKELMGSKFDSEHFHLFQNTGKGHFIDVTEQTKLDKVSFGMGLNFGDLNNDGYLDIFVGTGTPDYRSQIPNRAFMNIKGKNFKEVTFNYGLGNIQKGHGIGFGDFDNDGDQDIYMVLGGAFEGDNYFNALYQNNLVTPNNWITLKLEGKQSNSCAIGARIKLSGTNPSGIKKEIYLTVGTGGSFGASSLQQEIGIGDINSISVLEIMWPNKSQSIQLVEGLQVNQVYKIIEGDPNASPLKKNGFEYKTQSHSHTH